MLLKTALETMTDLADRLKKLRKQQKISQAKLAKLSGVSLGSLKRFETSGHISLASLVKLSVVLNRQADFDRLFEIDDKPKTMKELLDLIDKA